MLKIELKIQHPQGKPDIWCPVIFCDWCKQKIEKASQGMYCFMMTNDGEKGNTLYTVHLGKCNRLLEAKLEAQKPEGQDALFGWMPLSNLIGYLINNLDLGWNDLVMHHCPDEQIASIRKTLKLRAEEKARS